MGRHVRASRVGGFWRRAGSGVTAWAERTRAGWSRPKHAHAGGRPAAGDRQLVLAAALAALAVAVAVFALGGHGQPPRSLPGARPPRVHAGGRIPAAAPSATAAAASVPDAAPTPPPVSSGVTVGATSAPARPSAAAAASTGTAGDRGRGTAGAAGRTVTGARESATLSPSHTGGGSAPRAASPAAARTTPPQAKTGHGVRTTVRAPAAPPSQSVGAATAPGRVLVAPALSAAVPGIVAPVAGPVLAAFGWAYTPIFADWQEHTGVDLGAQVGAVVAAPAEAIVLQVRQDPLWGSVVSLALPNGYSTNLSGLEGVTVRDGEHLRAGEAVGRVGSSPPAEANLPPHVFWQVFDGTTPVNPVA